MLITIGRCTRWLLLLRPWLITQVILLVRQFSMLSASGDIRCIGCVSIDNASAIKVALEYLRGKLRKDEMLLEGNHMH